MSFWVSGEKLRGAFVTFAILGLATLANVGSARALSAVTEPMQLVEAEGLTVTAAAQCLPSKLDNFAAHPKVVSTFPANGAMVRPGVLVIRVSFDQPMSCKGFFASVPSLPSPCPSDHQNWILSFDRRTIRTVCHSQPFTAYGVRIGDPLLSPLVSLAGRSLDSYEIRFTTSVGMDVRSTAESLAEDAEMQPALSAFEPLPLQEAHVKK